ncbi:MAG: ROK family protein [Coleofasciculaceae cyanobacterium SM2_1_6]|nr:ROK family protein [Coleofasciculaceae cyanobacterium SM2_1_6]
MTEIKPEIQEVIGVDLGGTAIKLGRFLADGTSLDTLTLDTPQPSTPEAVLEAIVTGINTLLAGQPELKRSIGVGIPGPVDISGKIARVAINLAGWHDVPLGHWLVAKTGYPTVLGNDANCAGLGEAWLGAAKSFQDSLLLTLGTGVGGAIVLGGKLFVGHQGSAAELGLITLYPEGYPCNSGNQGSLEQYLSIGAIQRATGLEPIILGERAAAGDAQALEFWAEYGRYLGIGLTTLIYIFTPEAIVIGGGISASAEFFLPSAEAEIAKRVLPSSRSGLKIIPAELGNQAGMIGAVKLALSF